MHIHYTLEPIEGKKVLVVECDSSQEPVFLRQGSDESYLIRVGPGSRKLTMSQMLAHVERRSDSPSATDDSRSRT